MSAENACKSSSSLLFQYIYTLGRSQLSNYWYSICSIGRECECVYEYVWLCSVCTLSTVDGWIGEVQSVCCFSCLAGKTRKQNQNNTIISSMRLRMDMRSQEDRILNESRHQMSVFEFARLCVCMCELLSSPSLLCGLF